MIILVTLIVVCIADVSLVTAQLSSCCPSTLSDLNDHCDARCIGSRGFRGPVGKPGPRGFKGSSGQQGPPGAIGITGSKGSKGSVGAKGLTGNPGVMDSTAVKEIVKEIVHSEEMESVMRKIVYEVHRNFISTNCQEVRIQDAKVLTTSGGVFDIFLGGVSKTEVFCDLKTDGGGWTVFQRRMDGSEDFYRGWDDYVNGFGAADNEFWLGLENLHQMTKNASYELRIDLEDFSGNRAYAKYGSFRIDSSAQNYMLHVSSFSGDAGDSLDYHNGMEFSTRDADHDAWSSVNCAQSYKGAWWYRKWYHQCGSSNLNGIYRDAVGSGWDGYDGVIWYHWKNSPEYLKSTEMKFRKK